MSRGRFPTMLNKKATMLGSLTRYDLVVLGTSYLMLSWMKVSGLYSLATNALLLLVLKFIQRRLRPGFFSHLGDEKQLEWSYQLGGKHE